MKTSCTSAEALKDTSSAVGHLVTGLSNPHVKWGVLHFAEVVSPLVPQGLMNQNVTGKTLI